MLQVQHRWRWCQRSSFRDYDWCPLHCKLACRCVMLRALCDLRADKEDVRALIELSHMSEKAQLKALSTDAVQATHDDVYEKVSCRYHTALSLQLQSQVTASQVLACCCPAMAPIDPGQLSKTWGSTESKVPTMPACACMYSTKAHTA